MTGSPGATSAALSAGVNAKASGFGAGAELVLVAVASELTAPLDGADSAELLVHPATATASTPTSPTHALARPPLDIATLPFLLTPKPRPVRTVCPTRRHDGVALSNPICGPP
ncbi:hypothetical protein Acsp05_14690 [Actinokineospora sp. NBRC 105648]|nr:hypothetical protein Acsp05_14690 [Actinokineospora sp. NBRC 105648]